MAQSVGAEMLCMSAVLMVQSVELSHYSVFLLWRPAVLLELDSKLGILHPFAMFSAGWSQTTSLLAAWWNVVKKPWLFCQSLGPGRKMCNLCKASGI